ncbi:TetR/AcrR family transcriptional regulator [Methylobacterium nonmethylotrophicum]|uniref:TetR/AcrR family transcriptional regulator n=1 Tax=Methylobacterium nonmethylotrophicum TaxID=1141884 RepID=A0A4Z0NEN0_9HYPH|nr:TetR/AcrR family transcriptional regulator [Methylobacterium nonmethylotrophicum]TGD92737.1 TetR/AcrR family transcriptional regulator [Methylobacterium nonmethylotrophicum]
MRVTREQVRENRRRILEAAGRLLREKGFSAVTVAEVMEAAGLTHGGFYGHFASKEDLAAQALAQALIPAPREPGAAAGLAGFVASYLSAAHRDRPGTGCALAALGGEAARQPAPVRRAFTEGLEARLSRMQEGLPEGDRATALAALSGLVGALVLARAVDDPALSDEILAAARTALEPLGDRRADPPCAAAPRTGRP